MDELNAAAGTMLDVASGQLAELDGPSDGFGG
jgi:hypothetical protein